jgi:hypothetical protein
MHKFKQAKPNMKRQSGSLKAKSQQRGRRRHTIFKKVRQYCVECDADAYLVLRIRQTGQMYTLTSRMTAGWPPSLEHLVRQNHWLPIIPGLSLLTMSRTHITRFQSRRLWMMYRLDANNSHPENLF